MWISKSEHRRLIAIEAAYDDMRKRIQQYEKRDTNELYLEARNRQLKKDIEQLKVKYTDEVKKNFELASYLSENKSK